MGCGLLPHLWDPRSIPLLRLVIISDIKDKMSRPLNVKTVVVPKGQNEYGRDVVRFTADYAASDLYEQCIGCYPLVHEDLMNSRLQNTSPSPPLMIDPDVMTDEEVEAWMAKYVSGNKDICKQKVSQNIPIRKSAAGANPV